jgi:hypothetical protein
VKTDVLKVFQSIRIILGFEVLTAMNMKNSVLWDVTPFYPRE